MLQITQALARQLRTVLRKAFGGNKYLQSRTAVLFQGGTGGLLIRALSDNVGVEYFQAGAFDKETLVLPFTALQELEGRKDVPVTLEAVKPQCVQATWKDGSVPQTRQHVSPEFDKLPPWPETPAEFTKMAPTFLTVLEEAARTAAKESVRFAMTNIQLRASGEIVATDGKHLLIQSGFSFPWKDDVLVPAVDVFACRELPQDVPVNIDRTDTHLCVRVDPWTFFLPIDKDGRYPKAEMVIPNTKGSVTSWRLDPADAKFLVDALPKLPGADDYHEPITLDLDRRAVIRAGRAEDEFVTEVMLDRSTVEGPARRFVTNRCYLARAIELGFHEFQVVSENVPIVCRQAQRTYLWMLLGKDGALAPSDNSRQIHSLVEAPSPAVNVHTRRTTMQSPSNKGNGNGSGAAHTNGTASGSGHPATLPIANHETAATGTSLAAILKEAEALQDVIRDVNRRLMRLVSSLKRHRKQTRLMASTLASLRQLQQLPAVA